MYLGKKIIHNEFDIIYQLYNNSWYFIAVDLVILIYLIISQTKNHRIANIVKYTNRLILFSSLWIVCNGFSSIFLIVYALWVNFLRFFNTFRISFTILMIYRTFIVNNSLKLLYNIVIDRQKTNSKYIVVSIFFSSL